MQVCNLIKMLISLLLFLIPINDPIPRYLRIDFQSVFNFGTFYTICPVGNYSTNSFGIAMFRLTIFLFRSRALTQKKGRTLVFDFVQLVVELGRFCRVGYLPNVFSLFPTLLYFNREWYICIPQRSSRMVILNLLTA